MFRKIEYTSMLYYKKFYTIFHGIFPIFSRLSEPEHHGTTMKSANYANAMPQK